MSDREEIERLINQYSYAVDNGNFDAAARMFRNAKWGIPGRFEFDTEEAIREFFRGVELYEGRPRTRHVLTNVTIDIDGDTATATSYVQLLKQKPSGPIEILMAGTYSDGFKKDAGTWRFTQKLSHPELTMLNRGVPTDAKDG